MLSTAILIPAVLNGLLTGAVYALVALGLTLIYGVLHIINFAHGALLTAAMFAVFFAYKLLGLDPYVAAVLPHAAVLRARLRAAALRHRPAAHGEDRNILLVTLGLAVIIENALLYAFAPTRARSTCPTRFRRGRYRLRVPGGAARDRLCRGHCRGAGAVAADALHRHRQGDPRGRQGEARRGAGRHRRRAHLCDDLRHRHRLPRDRGLPADADLLRQSARRQRLRAGRLHHRGARRHGLGAGRAASAACSSAWSESLSGLYLGESLGQIGIFVIFILVLLFRPSGLFGARA